MGQESEQRVFRLEIFLTANMAKATLQGSAAVEAGVVRSKFSVRHSNKFCVKYKEELRDFRLLRNTPPETGDSAGT